jgi:hypothetical protein
MLTAEEVLGGAGPVSRHTLNRNPHRMQAFRLTGLYFREQEAQDLLAQIASHRWIEAEKAGRDIWSERDPVCPACAAGRDWLSRHFSDWLNWRARQRCEAC